MLARMFRFVFSNPFGASPRAVAGRPSVQPNRTYGLAAGSSARRGVSAAARCGSAHRLVGHLLPVQLPALQLPLSCWYLRISALLERIIPFEIGWQPEAREWARDGVYWLLTMLAGGVADLGGHHRHVRGPQSERRFRFA